MKKIFLLLLATQLAWGAIDNGRKYKLNQMGEVPNQVQLGTIIDEGGQQGLSKSGNQAQTTAIGLWDFAVNGGQSVQQHWMQVSIPKGAVITRTFFDVIQGLTGTGASIQVTAQTPGDLLASKAITSATNQFAGVSDNTVGNMKKMTAIRSVMLDIGSTALTGGSLKIYIDYYQSEPN